MFEEVQKKVQLINQTDTKVYIFFATWICASVAIALACKQFQCFLHNHKRENPGEAGQKNFPTDDFNVLHKDFLFFF